MRWACCCGEASGYNNVEELVQSWSDLPSSESRSRTPSSDSLLLRVTCSANIACRKKRSDKDTSQTTLTVHPTMSFARPSTSAAASVMRHPKALSSLSAICTPSLASIRPFSSTSPALGKSPPGKGKNAIRKARKAARLEKIQASQANSPVKQTKAEQQSLSFADAVRLFHSVEVARPNNAFELHVVTNVSSHQANALRGRVALPKETRTKSEKILVFADDGSEAAAAIASLRAGDASMEKNIVVGGAELIQDVVSGRGAASGHDFTKVLCTDSLLPQVSKALARSLGPRGLMPSAKRGTVVKTGAEMERAIREVQGAIDWRGDKNGVVRGAVGRINFSTPELQTNIAAFLHVIVEKINSGLSSGSGQVGVSMPTGQVGQLTPTAFKQASTILKQVHLSSTQGPAVLLSLPEVL